MPAKVVDASVLGAIIFEEPRAEDSDALVRGAELHAPALLAYELAHVAQKKANQMPAQREAFEAALSMDIHWSEVNRAAVLRLALDTGLTTYDASYLYVARRLSVDLVTFDAQLKSVWTAYIR